MMPQASLPPSLFYTGKAYLEASVDDSLVKELLEDPPDGLHEPGVHGLVVILEVNPATKAGHNILVGRTENMTKLGKIISKLE